MRGEHFIRCLPVSNKYGSSPHAWGTPGTPASGTSSQRFIPHAWGTRPTYGRTEAQRRFIPTCVGNTIVHSQCQCAATVHPHMRGEHPRRLQCDRQLPGSSPHAWGTHLLMSFLFPGNRFVPTCVGNTQISIYTKYADAVHPHMRGEHASVQFQKAKVSGSSPHAWGTLVVVRIITREQRFIPTCVGNTLTVTICF